MADRPWIVLVKLSDSFRTTLGEMAAQLGAGVVEWTPSDKAPAPGNAVLQLVLAGGAESEGVDLLAALGPSEVPRFFIGAAEDHRLAAAAIQDRKSTRLNSSHIQKSRMPSSA